MRILMPIITVAISALVTVAVLVPAIQYSEPEKGWQYDDYREGENISSVEGSIELVTFNGINYLHAKDLGQGTINYVDGTVEKVTVKKANLDIVFALGQSNNTYLNAEPSEAEPVPDYGTSYYFGNSSGPCHATNSSGGTMKPYYDADGVLVVGDKLPSFAAEYTEATGHKLFYVIGAKYGSSIRDWVPGGSCWNTAKQILQSAIDSVDTSKYNVQSTGYTWIQGESDRYTPQTEYSADFLALHNSLRDGEMGARFTQAFIALPMKYAIPMIAQEDLAEQYPTIHLVTKISSTFTEANGLLGADGLHYSQKGYNLIGAQLGEACGEAYAPADNSPTGAIHALIGIVPIVILAGLVIAVASRYALSQD